MSLFVLLTYFVASQAIWAQSPDGPEATTVYLTQEQALQNAFPEADTLWSEIWTPTPSQRKTVERRLGWRLAEPNFEIFQASLKEQHLGYAVITEQIGLYKPITFMVKVDSTGQNDGVWIMVYRESRGGEVKRQRFLTQYKGKKSTNPIRLNRDIIGVTGATLSVRALNGGVKRILTVIDVAYLQKQ
ncbi:MAG: thiamine biosynthesis lipoprotein [Candidatus Latescibacterota bacterium]|jgi:thiamine biosynthesis lipoprotein